MKKIVGVKFRKPGKIYFFDQGDIQIKVGDKVIVETSLGQELATVKIANRQIDELKTKDPLKKVIKIADEKDLKHQEDNVEKETSSNSAIELRY